MDARVTVDGKILTVEVGTCTMLTDGAAAWLEGEDARLADFFEATLVLGIVHPLVYEEVTMRYGKP